ncbi:hypothetical protein P7K49_026414 [Saguinus oedipus]|uniref:Uncharacterized protein n=1 Tax=Saguinus oedipus TaxID=9490 RepID=A0ABQ9UD45_SAGOE|nr:hypothetical protein P7K49_026414 [Saguinus oedipus]
MTSPPSHLRLAGQPNKTAPLHLLQERLVLSVLPRFVVLEMINDMTNVEDEHLQHQFHRIYIHRYENVSGHSRIGRSQGYVQELSYTDLDASVCQTVLCPTAIPERDVPQI